MLSRTNLNKVSDAISKHIGKHCMNLSGIFYEGQYGFVVREHRPDIFDCVSIMCQHRSSSFKSAFGVAI
jgi:hypothetical protein